MKIFLESSDATGRVVENLLAPASSASFSASVGAGLSIIDVPHVAFGDLVDSTLSTLTVTFLGHVTKVLSSAYDANTLFYEVNVTSLTYTVDASASSDAAAGLDVDGKAAPAIYTVHSTSPAYQENRVLVSARDATTTIYVVHAFFQPVPCNCYAHTCNAFDSSCMCDAEWYKSSCNAHCPGSGPCHDRDVRHGIRLGLCVQRDVRWPRLQRAKLSPLSSAFFVLGRKR